MKKSTNLFLVLACLVLMVFTGGCDQCNDIDCPQDVEFPDFMERRIPYQVGQVIRFANANGDTIILTCERRQYAEQPVVPNDRVGEECCSAVNAEVLDCSLKDSVNGIINIGTSFFPTNTDSGGFYVTYYSGILDNFQYQEDDYYGHQQETLELNNNIFYNVLVIDKNPNFVMYNSLDGLGIVGFKINGKEWALVD